jgi:hypothetical protein
MSSEKNDQEHVFINSATNGTNGRCEILQKDVFPDCYILELEGGVNLEKSQRSDISDIESVNDSFHNNNYQYLVLELEGGQSIQKKIE